MQSFCIQQINKSIKFYPVKTDAIRDSIYELIGKKYPGTWHKCNIKDDFYLQPENSSYIESIFSSQIALESIFRTNNISLKPEPRTVKELLPHRKEYLEDKKTIAEFDRQILDYLDKIPLEEREEPPKEFFTTYSNFKICFPVFLLYLFVILVGKTAIAIHNY